MYVRVCRLIWQNSFLYLAFNSSGFPLFRPFPYYLAEVIGTGQGFVGRREKLKMTWKQETVDPIFTILKIGLEKPNIVVVKRRKSCALKEEKFRAKSETVFFPRRPRFFAQLIPFFSSFFAVGGFPVFPTVRRFARLKLK